MLAYSAEDRIATPVKWTRGAEGSISGVGRKTSACVSFYKMLVYSVVYNKLLTKMV
jgi:hypothetical protein